jgi:hypothetical protein
MFLTNNIIRHKKSRWFFICIVVGCLMALMVIFLLGSQHTSKPVDLVLKNMVQCVPGLKLSSIIDSSTLNSYDPGWISRHPDEVALLADKEPRDFSAAYVFDAPLDNPKAAPSLTIRVMEYKKAGTAALAFPNLSGKMNFFDFPPITRKGYQVILWPEDGRILTRVKNLVIIIDVERSNWSRFVALSILDAIIEELDD